MTLSTPRDRDHAHTLYRARLQDDEDNFRLQPDWHPPGLAEDRINQLFKVHTDQLKYPPSFISLHSGRELTNAFFLSGVGTY